MEVKDILALAKAGFTAEQIAALSADSSSSSGSGSSSSSGSGSSSSTGSSSSSAPAPESGDDLKAAIADLKNLIITSNLSGAAQPPVQSVDDILAQVINPPRKEEE